MHNVLYNSSMISHREQKKQMMRQALIDSAYELFAQKGYAATTLADITQRANCAPRTFFQYFTSKEELLVVGLDQVYDNLEKSIKERAAGTTTFQAMRGWALEAVDKILAVDPPIDSHEEVKDAVRVAAQARRRLYLTDKIEAILAPELAKDLKVEPHSVEPKLIAVATAAILDAYHNNSSLAKTERRKFINKAFSLLDGLLESAKQAVA